MKPLGIGVTIVQPGFFRTDFLDTSSVRFADEPISDYGMYAGSAQEAYTEQCHQQAGDPAKLAAALIQLSREEEPPLRFAAGSDAMHYLGTAYDVRQSALSAWEALSRTTDIEGNTASNAAL